MGSCLLAVVLFALGARVFLLTALDRVWGPSCCPSKRVVAVGEAPSPWVQCASASAAWPLSAGVARPQPRALSDVGRPAVPSTVWRLSRLVVSSRYLFAQTVFLALWSLLDPTQGTWCTFVGLSRPGWCTA